MFRQRVIGGCSYVKGIPQRVRINNDAVYHTLQLDLKGLVKSNYGLAPSGPLFDSQFPFSLMRNIRVIRNGSDVVFQGSGSQLAHEHLLLNGVFPHARMFTRAGNVQTLKTKVVAGVTVPSNAAGIGANCANFEGTSTASTDDVTSIEFEASVELWFQLKLSGSASTNTLVDSRELSTFTLEIEWADESEVMIPGTANTKNTITCELTLNSMDQDNVALGLPFGTFKRSSRQVNNIGYGSGNQQVLLDRGNYQFGLLFETKAYKAGSALMALYENNVISTIQNNINSNFSLRNTSFEHLQRKNVSDGGGINSPFSVLSAGPMGKAAFQYADSLDNPGELIMTQTTDVWELKLALEAIGSATNGATTAGTMPIINILSQEVIPGVTVSEAAPQGAQAGSIGRTTNKPYTK